MITKKALREQQLHFRQLLPESEYRRLNLMVMRRLLALPEIKDASTIHCYWPIIEKRELDTRDVIQKLSKEGKRVVLPVVSSFNTREDKKPRLEHRVFSGETNLEKNRWGIHEPATVKLVDNAPGLTPVPASLLTADLEAIIVPALAVDTRGFRLGYGKGFYDEFLARCICPFICPIFSQNVLTTLPVMPHDIPVDIIVTEHEVIRVAQ